MFSNTLSFLSSRNVSNQVSHPYKTTGNFFLLVKKYWADKMTYERTKYENISSLTETSRQRKGEIKWQSASEKKFQTSYNNKLASSALTI